MTTSLQCKHTDLAERVRCLEDRAARADHQAFRIAMFGYGTNPQWQGEQVRAALRCDREAVA